MEFSSEKALFFIRDENGQETDYEAFLRTALHEPRDSALDEPGRGRVLERGRCLSMRGSSIQVCRTWRLHLEVLP